MTSDKWEIKLSTKLSKSIGDLPEHVRFKMLALFKALEERGAIQSDWPNYGKLADETYHCHVKKGRPTYVVCWRILDKKQKLIEVYYAGTHEKAPY